MDSFWQVSKNIGPSENDKFNEAIAFGTIAVLFLIVEIWCIISTIKTFRIKLKVVRYWSISGLHGVSLVK